MRELALFLVLGGCTSETLNLADGAVPSGDGKPAVDSVSADASLDAEVAESVDARVDRSEDAEVGDAAPADPADAAAHAPSRLGCSSECTTALADTVAEGTTPWGHFVAEQVGVVYVLGFMNSTDIFVLGQLEGKPVELYVKTSASLTDFVTPPGTYTSGQDSSSVWGYVYGLNASDVCSAEALGSLTVTIQEHVGPEGSAAPGSPVELTGSLDVSGGGWDLEIPLDIRGVCDKQTSI